jgi:hypothetical protein
MLRSGKISLGSAIDREQLAAIVPFVLRAWVLRDREENSSLNFGDNSTQTLPLFSLYSDPLCDAANMDFYQL